MESFLDNLKGVTLRRKLVKESTNRMLKTEKLWKEEVGIEEVRMQVSVTGEENWDTSKGGEHTTSNGGERNSASFNGVIL